MNNKFDIQNGILVNYTGNDAEVTIPESVIEIGRDAFSNNKTVTEVNMPDTVVKIGANAFEKCIKLKEVVFSKNLEEIEYHGFAGCKALKEVELPDTLKELGSSCFVGCDKLTKMTCESEVFEATSNPFESYGEKTPIGIADKDGFIIFAGVLYCYIGEEKEINVPDGVTQISPRVFNSGEYSWEKKYDIEKVVLPDSVKYIGDSAFRNCKKLKSVSMPAEIKVGEQVFEGCDGLADDTGFFVQGGVALSYCGNSEKVVIPNGTRVITPGLFANGDGRNEGNSKIHEIVFPEGLEIIGDYAFEGCEFIEEIIIPKSVHTIGEFAFKNCGHLSKLEIPKTVKNIGEGILRGCRSLADKNGFVISNNTIQSFYGADRNIEVPEGVVAIANGAFNETGIISINLPSSLRKLGAAFRECEMLEEIVIPEGVTEIVESTFSNCYSLARVVLPSTIETIEERAFYYCNKLSEINIPESVMLIGKYAFCGCKSLNSVRIPSKIKMLKHSTFDDCENLAEITLSEGLESIESEVFRGSKKLKEIIVPDTVKRIGYSAFDGCSSLTKVIISSEDIEIDESAFDDCPKLMDKNGFTIVNGVLYKYEGKGGNVTVPEGVVSIATNVFREGYSRERRSYQTFRKEGSLKTIILPKTLKKIGDNVFDSCEALTEIVIPDTVESIGALAFYGCKKLGVVTLSAELISIGANAFYECESLKEMSIPAKVNYIGDDAYRECKKLKEFSVADENGTFSSIDGALMNKDGDTIIFVPAGKKLTEYTVSENVISIGKHAFVDCATLKKIVIPANVKNVGDEAFPRYGWGTKVRLTDIEVDPKAGSGTIGEEIFDIYNWDNPLVYPKLPVTFVKEVKTQVTLALGFCLNPEKYEGEYFELYKEYAASHEKTLTRKATSAKLTGISEYFSGKKDSMKSKNKADGVEDAADINEYKPDLSIKKPSELVKVEILEEVVQKGTLQDVKDVINTYKSFEMTARALGLAARYRGVEFVKVLVEGGATFKYKSEGALQRKYKMDQSTASGNYKTEYYLMMVPEKLKEGSYDYAYSPMTGVPNILINPGLVPLSLEKRIEVVKYLSEKKNSGVSLDEMLFWALTTDELAFADALIDMGINLRETPPKYYSSWGQVPTPTYITVVTSAPQSTYWNSYVDRIAKLKPSSVYSVLERFGNLAAKVNQKIVISQKMFEEVKWNDKSLAYILKNADMSKVNQKKALEKAVASKAIGALEIMAESGWLSNSKKREVLIEFARTNKHKEALAWLMDYKNKTVDVAAEEAKEEAKMFKELTEDPNSVSALKKKWSYVKLDNGTLQITSYKGDEEEVEIPSVIGKASVTSIGKEAFFVWKQSIKNKDSRRRIRTVVIPDGVTEIGFQAFEGCESIETIKIPSTIKVIREAAFSRCPKLKELNLPSGLKVERYAFNRCEALANKEGLIVIGDTLFAYCNLNKKNSMLARSEEITKLVVPEGVTKIAPYALQTRWSRELKFEEVILPEGLVEIGERAFYGIRINKVVFPSTLKKIGKEAFCNCYLSSFELPEELSSIGVAAFESNLIKELRIPKSLTNLPSRAFCRCRGLRDVYIPDTVKKFGDAVFGEKDGWSKAEGIYVHTPSGSAAEEYVKEFGGIYVSNDYE